MNFFDEASLRLKQELKVTEDKQAAELLGLSASAWKQRKTRDSFPEKELWALSAQRRDIDVTYVLRGVRTYPNEPVFREQRERDLLDNFRVADEAEKVALLRLSYAARYMQESREKQRTIAEQLALEQSSRV
jgi:hypothetical protein